MKSLIASCFIAAALSTCVAAAASAGPSDRYQRSARNGFYWWEFDPTWYAIRLMAVVGLAWDLHPVPERIYQEARTLKESRTPSRVVSVVQPTALHLELAEDES